MCGIAGGGFLIVVLARGVLRAISPVAYTFDDNPSHIGRASCDLHAGPLHFSADALRLRFLNLFQECRAVDQLVAASDGADDHLWPVDLFAPEVVKGAYAVYQQARSGRAGAARNGLAISVQSRRLIVEQIVGNQHVTYSALAILHSEGYANTNHGAGVVTFDGPGGSVLGKLASLTADDMDYFLAAMDAQASEGMSTFSLQRLTSGGEGVQDRPSFMFVKGH